MPETDPSIRCHYRDSAGRRCRLPRMQSHPTFCIRHARPATPEPTVPEIDLSQELLGPLTDFRSATSINYVLGRLLVLKAAGLISPRDASISAYICQLIMQTVPAVRKEMSCSRLTHPDYQDLRGVIEATASVWDEEQDPEENPEDDPEESPAPVAAKTRK